MKICTVDPGCSMDGVCYALGRGQPWQCPHWVPEPIDPCRPLMTTDGDPVVVLDHDGTWLFGRVTVAAAPIDGITVAGIDHYTVWCMADGSYVGVSGMWSGVRLVNVSTCSRSMGE